jgi:hypothetical protein
MNWLKRLSKYLDRQAEAQQPRIDQFPISDLCLITILEKAVMTTYTNPTPEELGTLYDARDSLRKAYRAAKPQHVYVGVDLAEPTGVKEFPNG